jgi:hypothetical protein
MIGRNAETVLEQRLSWMVFSACSLCTYKMRQKNPHLHSPSTRTYHIRENSRAIHFKSRLCVSLKYETRKQKSYAARSGSRTVDTRCSTTNIKHV